MTKFVKQFEIKNAKRVREIELALIWNLRRWGLGLFAVYESVPTVDRLSYWKVELKLGPIVAHFYTDRLDWPEWAETDENGDSLMDL
jgi:hypothetical protein